MEQSYFKALVTRDTTESAIIPVAAQSIREVEALATSRDVVTLFSSRFERNEGNSEHAYLGGGSEDVEEITKEEYEALLAGEGTGIYAVTGRIPGDDDDTTMLFEADSEEHARLAFEVEIYEEREVSREDVLSAWGDSIFITNCLEVSPSNIRKPASPDELRKFLLGGSTGV